MKFHGASGFQLACRSVSRRNAADLWNWNDLKGGKQLWHLLIITKYLVLIRTYRRTKVRAAYLKRTKQFHPDLHPDDPKAKAKVSGL